MMRQKLFVVLAVPPQCSIIDMRITAVPVTLFNDYTTFGYDEIWRGD